ncbi:uncharacterized protein LOC135680888 [Rhopilema esculentum]|uniref:uncharacterized protein LOC135680888 n=1 Tax=Rhopilema esculentum TaxID=499914 RepID=UPI0031D56CDE
MISTNSRSLFLLNTKTGAITVASSLMPYANSTFNMVIGARDDDGGVMSNKAKLSATVIFKIEPASADVLCVSLMSAYLMEIKSAQFKRNLQELIGLDIEIVEILPRETKKGCEIKFNAYNKTTKTVVSRPAVLRTVKASLFGWHPCCEVRKNLGFEQVVNNGCQYHMKQQRSRRNQMTPYRESLFFHDSMLHFNTKFKCAKSKKENEVGCLHYNFCINCFSMRWRRC